MEELTDKQVLELIESYTMFEDRDDCPIYRWVHSQLAGREDHCENLHEDWRQETIETYNRFVEEKLL